MKQEKKERRSVTNIFKKSHEMLLSTGRYTQCHLHLNYVFLNRDKRAEWALDFKVKTVSQVYVCDSAAAATTIFRFFCGIRKIQYMRLARSFIHIHLN